MVIKRRRYIFLMSVCLLLSGAVADAGNDPLEPPDLERYLRWGPVRVRPGLQLSDFGYDDNIFYRSENSDGVESDFKGSLTPRVEGLILLGDRAFLTFDEALKFTVYRKYSELNYFDNRGRARLTVPFGEFGLFTEVRIDRVHSRPIDQDDIRPLRKLNKISIGGIVRIGWRTELEISHGRSTWKNEDDDFGDDNTDIAEILDREERQNRLDLVYTVFGRTSLTANLSNRSIEFDTPVLSGEPGVSRDSRETRIVPGIRFEAGGPLTGSLQIGWARLEHIVTDPALPNFSGMVGDAELAYRFSSGTTAILTGERIVDFSVYEGNNYYVWDRYQLKGIHYLNRLIGFDLSAGTGNLSIPGSNQREDEVTEYGGGFRLRFSETDIGRRVEYTLGVRKVKRTSTAEIYDRSHTIVSVGAVVGY